MKRSSGGSGHFGPINAAISPLGKSYCRAEDGYIRLHRQRRRTPRTRPEDEPAAE